MADNEVKIPDGWIKVKSKSRAGKFYYFNSTTNRSVWSIDDIDKADKTTSNNGKRGSPKKKTPTKVEIGLSIQSKLIARKNIARDRMKKLQNALKTEVEKNDDGVSVKKSQTSPKKLRSSAVPVSPAKPTIATKNVASKRLEKFKQQLKDEVEVVNATSSTTTTEINNIITTEVEMMDFEEMTSTPAETETVTINFEEPMEWEDVPVEMAVLAVHQLRQDDFNGNSLDDAQFNDVKTQHHASSGKSIEFHIVVDTNVLIANLDFVQQIKGKYFKGEPTQFVTCYIWNFMIVNYSSHFRHRKSDHLLAIHRTQRARQTENSR